MFVIDSVAGNTRKPRKLSCAVHPATLGDVPLKLSGEFLNRLAAAYRGTAPAQCRALTTRRAEEVLGREWTSRSEVEDILLSLDARLREDRAGDVRLLSDLFGILWTWVTARPRKRANDAYLHEALRAAELAELLIGLERLGFAVDPCTLVEALLPNLRNASTLTKAEAASWFYGRNRHKREPLVLWRDERLQDIIRPTQTQKLPNGYRVEVWTAADGEVTQIRVKAPKYRQRPEPELVKCAVCGVDYLRGDPDDTANHRRYHMRELALLEPKPHARLQASSMRFPAPMLVTHRSPAWMHREIYRRASAFRRMFGYSFVQWGSEKGESDVEAHGFLIPDARGAIIGACAFRRNHEDSNPDWRLDFIWIAPAFRRQGYLAAHWSSFCARFGAFGVESPISEGMRGFLLKDGGDHPPT